MTLLVGLFIAGIVLIIAEFFLPGMVAGIIGIFCLIAATAMAFNQFGTTTGFYIATSEIIVGIIAFFLWIKYFPKSFLGRIFSLKEEAPKQSSAPENFEKLLGATGKTASMLRPSGIAQINGQRYDVVSEGSHIPADQDIKVVKVEGIRIVVRPLEP